MNFLLNIQSLLDKTRQLDFLAPLLLRIFLAPILIIAGFGKITNLENTSLWFEHSLGMPFPYLMAILAGFTEFLGGIAILIGLATRYAAIPLMFTMIVAATTAHWQNGWHVLPETTLTVPWEWRMDKIEGAAQRRDKAREILKEHSNYKWITEHGSVTILKNGIEFAATYFLMLLVLFFYGGGRYVSIDYWIKEKVNPG
ncbi:MAG: DoxX family protein [Thioalkalispiraceae bacterium]|jgi:uncharacterized membrane protein YphA (DoxX/SURF4 family)